MWTEAVCELKQFVNWSGLWTEAVCEMKGFVNWSGLWTDLVCELKCLWTESLWTDMVCETKVCELMRPEWRPHVAVLDALYD